MGLQNLNKERHLNKFNAVARLDKIERGRVKESARWHFQHRPYEHVKGVEPNGLDIEKWEQNQEMLHTL